MIKKLLGLLVALSMTSQVFASIAVAPMRIEINANKVKGNYLTTAINVTGDANKVMRFKVTKGYFTLNSRAELDMVEDVDTKDPHDISKNIKYVPAEFNVLPGKSQKVRINIVNLNQLPDGESRGILFIEDVDPREISIDTGRTGFGAHLIIKTRLGVPIYIDKGKVEKIGEIESLNVVRESDGFYTRMKINSKGNSRIRYTGKVQIINDKKLVDEYNIDGHPVGHGNYYVAKDKIRTDKLKPNTEYTLRAIISYEDGNGKKQNIKKETTLDFK